MKKRLMSFLLVAVMLFAMMPVTVSADSTPVIDRVQLWDGGPYWATTNVGATKPEESGYYFWWGDTVGYKRNVEDNGWVSSSSEDEISFIDRNQTASQTKMNKEDLYAQGWIDENGVLVPLHDAATQKMGDDWRMPTKAEWEALVLKCHIETVTDYYGTGVSGIIVYKSKNTNDYSSSDPHIFLPAAGHGKDTDLVNTNNNFFSYWLSEVSQMDGTAYSIYGSGEPYTAINSTFYGFTIRAVTEVPAYKVTYDANGAEYGNVPTDSNLYEPQNEVSVLDNSNELSKTGYTFDGWNTKADGSGTTYKAGDTFTITAETKLYAMWAYEKTPRTENPTLEINGQFTYGQETPLPEFELSGSPYEDNPVITFYYNTAEDYDGALEWKDMTSTTLNAGDYYVFAIFGETEKHLEYTLDMMIKLTILKADAKVTSPSGKTLEYTGEEQELISKGSVEGGSMLYSLDGKKYSADVPKAKEAGEYTVYYKVVGDVNHNDVAPNSVKAKIAETGSPLPPDPDPTPDPAPDPSPTPDPDPEPKPVEVYYAPLVSDLKSNAEGVIEWKAGDSLPLEAVRLLVEKPELSLEFTFTYEGEEHEIYIPAGAFEQYYDVNIPWYGPAWLIQHFEKKSILEYIVKKDDTINNIAKAYNTTAVEILKLNPNIKNPNLIYPGNKLNVPAK